MLWSLLGYLVASFIMTTMLSQMFPDGRFPLKTILLVILAGVGGAWLGNVYLSESTVFSGGLIGASLVSGGLLFILHRTGLLVQPPEMPSLPESTKEQQETHDA